MDKTRVLILLSLLLGLKVTFSQENDSTYVMQFFDKTEYPEVDTVFYYKKYKLGKLTEEGWRVVEQISPKSKIVRSSDTTGEFYGEYNLGVWKFYRNGKLTRIDTNSFVNQMFVSIEHHYWRNGNLKYHFYSKVDYNAEDRPEIKTGGIKDWKYPGDDIRFIYNRKGILKKKQVWKNDKFIEDVKY